MDIFTDPRFIPYLKNTTVTKFFPKKILSQQQAKNNPIYKILKQDQIFDQEEKKEYQQRVQTQQNMRRSSMSMSENKFIRHKTVQRVRTMNSFIIDGDFSRSNSKKLKIKPLGNKFNQALKINSFSFGVERFQKSLENEKKKCSLLKKYSKVVENHFERFQPNEDKTRMEIIQHNNIVRLLLNRKEENTQQNGKQGQNDILVKQQKRLREQNLLKEKQMKEILSSAHCQKKVEKAVNSYVREISQHQNRFSHKTLTTKSKINIKRVHTQSSDQIVTSHDNFLTVSKVYNLNKSKSVSEKGHDKENQFFKINLLKVPANKNKDKKIGINNRINVFQKSKMKKLTLSKNENVSSFNRDRNQIKLTISSPFFNNDYHKQYD